MIITKSISRLARNTVTLLETVRELQNLGVAIYFEEQNIRTDSADGELMLTILASYAQEESRDVSESCKWRVRKNMQAGTVAPRKAYGFRVERGTLTIVPEQADIVRRIFAEYIGGAGSNKIANGLNADGIPSPTGAAWHHNTVVGIL
jgi:DNA invertase Pin-like site-specific DNA recombinase